jgi:hypothetical protein
LSDSENTEERSFLRVVDLVQGRCSVLDVSSTAKERPCGGYVYIYHNKERPFAWQGGFANQLASSMRTNQKQRYELIQVKIYVKFFFVIQSKYCILITFYLSWLIRLFVFTSSIISQYLLLKDSLVHFFPYSCWLEQSPLLRMRMDIAGWRFSTRVSWRLARATK